MTFFVTSDTHFGHKNIFEDGYCPKRREWFSGGIKEHDDALVNIWNGIVGPDDTVIHCGDFAFGNAAQVSAYRDRLNGHIWMVLGNHDRTLKSMTKCICRTTGDVIANGLYLSVNGFNVAVRHMPVICEDDMASKYEFTAHDASANDRLWHGHIHDRPYVPISEKLVAWGIDTHPWKIVRIDADVRLLMADQGEDND